MSSRKEREWRFRRQLLADTASDLFHQHTYEKVTMQDIATAAECGKATLYQYFSSKEEILGFVLTGAQKDLLAQLELACDGSQPVFSELHTYIQLQYQFYLHYGPLIISMMKRKLEGTLNPDLFREAFAYRTRKLDLLAEVLQRGIDLHLLVNMDSHKLARVLHNIIRGFSLEIMESGQSNRDPQNDIELIAQVLSNGILIRGEETAK